MKRLKDWSSAGSKYNPMLYVPSDFENAAKQFSEAHPKFILFQRKGGINPVCSREERIRAANSPEVGLIRSWPMKESIKFVAEAKEAGLVNLSGHRSIGGMRASIYNAMPKEGVEALNSFMKKFEEENK